MDVGSKAFICEVVVWFWSEWLNFIWIFDDFSNWWFQWRFIVLIYVCVAVEVEWNLSLFLGWLWLEFWVRVLLICQWLLRVLVVLGELARVCLNVCLMLDSICRASVSSLVVPDWNVFVTVENFWLNRLRFHLRPVLIPLVRIHITVHPAFQLLLDILLRLFNLWKINLTIALLSQISIWIVNCAYHSLMMNSWTSQTIQVSRRTHEAENSFLMEFWLYWFWILMIRLILSKTFFGLIYWFEHILGGVHHWLQLIRCISLPQCFHIFEISLLCNLWRQAALLLRKLHVCKHVIEASLSAVNWIFQASISLDRRTSIDSILFNVFVNLFLYFVCNEICSLIHSVHVIVIDAVFFGGCVALEFLSD